LYILKLGRKNMEEAVGSVHNNQNCKDDEEIVVAEQQEEEEEEAVEKEEDDGEENVQEVRHGPQVLSEHRSAANTLKKREELGNKNDVEFPHNAINKHKTPVKKAATGTNSIKKAINFEADENVANVPPPVPPLSTRSSKRLSMK
jgi:chromatin segregation and condensation protein Rec8/ScpA/Scc1 (kleisin family)